jgi:hypothetical protein
MSLDRVQGVTGSQRLDLSRSLSSHHKKNSIRHGGREGPSSLKICPPWPDEGKRSETVAGPNTVGSVAGTPSCLRPDERRMKGQQSLVDAGLNAIEARRTHRVGRGPSQNL